jgi:hypothetical protein
MNDMNTLVIHPQDPTTEFLTKIYQNLDNTNVIRRGVSKDKVSELITTHDRCFFLGHGTPNGLMSVGMFKNSWGYIIDIDMVSSLIHQKNNLYIWCHAKLFVELHDLHGLYSDMFISEVSEAEYHGFQKVSQSEITESNDVFSKIIGSNIHKSHQEIYDIVKTEYGRFGNTNRIAKYNTKRIFIR